MLKLNRLKNRGITWLADTFPAIAKHLEASYAPLEFEEIPWVPIKKPLAKSKIAIVTTAGIHHSYSESFLSTKTWQTVQKKIERSKRIWGELSKAKPKQ